MRIVGILIARIVGVLVLGLSLTACSQGQLGASGSGSSAPSISGTVSGIAVTNSSTSYLAEVFSRASLPGYALTTPSDGCQSGTYVTALPGAGRSRLGRGIFSGGKFQISGIPAGRELVVTFTCNDGSTQRCLVKSGDTGVSCNAVADSVLGAFEVALEKKITDKAFSYRSIAKVSSSIAQAAAQDTTATDAFIRQINTCKAISNEDNKVECYNEAIDASPFLGAFVTFKTMGTSWDIDSLFTFVIDTLGAQIKVDNIVFSGFGLYLGYLADSTFVSETQAYIEEVSEDQEAGGNGFVTKLECQVRYTIYQSTGILKYSPKIETLSNGVKRPTCVDDEINAKPYGFLQYFMDNGLNETQAKSYFSNINAGATNIEFDLSWCPPPVAPETSTSCDAFSGGVYVDNRKGCQNTSKTNSDPFNTPGALCYWTPELVITSRFEEPNRNDPDGTREDITPRPMVEMIKMFPEAIEAIDQANAEDNLLRTDDDDQCLFLFENQPPMVMTDREGCSDWFEQKMDGQQQNFAGMFGLYRYLKAGKAGAKLSLEHIHKLFSLSNLMNHRAVLRGNDTCGAEVQTGPSTTESFPALADLSSGKPVAQAGFGCELTPKTPISTEDAEEALEGATIPYDNSFKMFERIPTATQINNFVFGASTHAPWNLTGPKQFWPAGIYEAGGTKFPIFCKMRNKLTSKPKETELNATTAIDCLDRAGLTAVNPSIAAPDENGVMAVLPEGYPYVLVNYGYHDDGKGQIFALADAKSGRLIRVSGNPILVKQLHPGNSSDCDETDLEDQTNDPGSVFSEKVGIGFGASTSVQTTKMYCMNMSNFQSPGSYFLYQGGMVSIKQVNQDGTSWDWKAPQIGIRNPTSPNVLLPICYFAHGTTPGLQVSSSSDLTTASLGATLNGMTGELTTIGTSDRIDLCSKASTNYASYTMYYLTMMGGWNQTNRSDLKIGLVASSIGGRPLKFKNWDATVTSWDQLLVFMRPGLVERKYMGNSGGNAATDCADATPPANCKSVAPASVQTPIINVKLANQRWNPKFDPFCDDINGNDKCDCFEKGTTTLKDPDTCNLQDDPAEPPINQALFYPGHPNAVALKDLFDQMGGLAGADLQFVRDSNGEPTATTFNGAYLRTSNLQLDVSSTFICQYKATGESTYRTPATIQWDNFGRVDHGGCPNASGSDTAGGPIRMVKPAAAANSYVVSRPHTLIKLINYATKTTGQNVKLKKTDLKFTFDEALALVTFRKLLPASHEPVYKVGGSEIASGTVLNFEQVRVPGDDAENMDVISGVLRAITYPEELAD